MEEFVIREEGERARQKCVIASTYLMSFAMRHLPQVSCECRLREKEPLLTNSSHFMGRDIFMAYIICHPSPPARCDCMICIGIGLAPGGERRTPPGGKSHFFHLPGGIKPLRPDTASTNLWVSIIFHTKPAACPSKAARFATSSAYSHHTQVFRQTLLQTHSQDGAE